MPCLGWRLNLIYVLMMDSDGDDNASEVEQGRGAG